MGPFLEKSLYLGTRSAFQSLMALRAIFLKSDPQPRSLDDDVKFLRAKKYFKRPKMDLTSELQKMMKNFSIS